MSVKEYYATAIVFIILLQLISGVICAEPFCQGSLLQYSPRSGVMFLSNSSHPSKRQNLCISVSHEEGKTWGVKKSVCSGKAAYSDMDVLENEDVLCIFETDRLLAHGSIYQVVINKNQLMK